MATAARPRPSHWPRPEPVDRADSRADSRAVAIPDSEITAEFISSIGAGGFFRAFGAAVGHITPYDTLLFFLYRPDAAPVLLSNDDLPETNRRGLENYLDHTYLLNPVYQAFRSDIACGVYLMADILPDGYRALIDAVEFEIKIDDRETIGYLTPGWPRHMEELMPLINLPDGSMVEVTILRKRDIGFSRADCRDLARVFPVASAVLHKHWQLAKQDFSAQASRPSLDNSFDDFGADVLTNREAQVVKLVLTGHSSESISLRLGISVATIKTHRRNIYAKLQIGSQAELFSRFIRFLSTRSAP